MRKGTISIDGVRYPLRSREQVDAELAGGWRLVRWRIRQGFRRFTDSVASVFS